MKEEKICGAAVIKMIHLIEVIRVNKEMKVILSVPADGVGK